MNEPVLECPHCKEFIIIEKLNCGIFRHGVFISTAQQIPPHEKKEICDYYYNNKLIYGCGKPFQIIEINDTFELKICDYI